MSLSSRRHSPALLLALVALIGAVLVAPPAWSQARGGGWLSSGSDPVGLHEAVVTKSAKLPAEFVSRLRHERDGILRVMVSVTERTSATEAFVQGSTTWARWYYDNPRFYAGVTPDQLQSLLESPAVTFVEPDVPLTYFNAASTIDVGARSLQPDGPGVWSFDPDGGPFGALTSNIPGLTADQATGKGVTVAITDSGIDKTFRDFGGWDCAHGPYMPCESRIVRNVATEHLIGGIDPGDSLPTTEAASGHGSHVAGTVAGNGFYARDGDADAATYGADGIPFGVAPQANLIMTKNGDTLWAGLSQFGLEWQLENAEAYGIKVSSNSWGCLGGCSFNGASATGQLFKNMYEAGIVVVFAVGNDGGTQSGTSFSGNAQSPYVLGVASYDDTTNRLATTSSRGSDNSLPDAATWTPESEPVNGERRPDVAAPGVDIWSARTLTGGTASGVPRQSTSDAIGGGTLCCIRNYAIMGGTSMATPHVAGAAALGFSACPTARPLDIMRAVMATAGDPVLKSNGSGPAEPFETGFGGLQVRAAVDWLLARNCDSNSGGTSEPTPDPTESPTPDPTPTETEPPPPTGGGTTYYLHSLTGLGNGDWLAGDSTFDQETPTFEDPSTFYDVPGIGNGAATAPWDPFWTGTVAEKIVNVKLDLWVKTPVGDLLGRVRYNPSLWVGDTEYPLPTLDHPVDPQVGNAPSRITKTYTTMLDAAGDEIPLSIDPAGQTVALTISGAFLDEEAASAMYYDSIDNPSSFTVNLGSTDPDPDPTESPTPTPDPTETTDPGGGSRGSYPVDPNDPLFADQWGMTTIKAPEAWQETNATGHGVKIAVVDSGVDLGHEDFACGGKLEVLPDSNIGGSGQPQDDDGHGTHVAGIAGACTNNGTGVVGVAPDATIMPVRVFDEPDLDKAMADGIRFAADNGAHVINLSIGDIPPFSHLGPDLYPQTEEALEHARNAGVVIASAAGNFDQPTCEYPSMSRNVICVVATDRNDMRAYYTDFPVNIDRNADEPGLEPVVAAPGGQGTFCEEAITSTYLRSEDSICHTSGYEALDGTSMSAPHVAGIAALMYDRLGGERSRANADLIVEKILESSDDLYTPGWDPIVGFGRVNALEAVRAIPLVEPTPTEDPGPAATSLAFTDSSAESGQHTDNAELEVALTDAESGTAIEGAEIVFELTGASGTRSFSATTDADGIAGESFKIVERPDQYVLTARYAGDAENFAGSADSTTFIVDPEDSETTLTVDGNGNNRTATASLTDADDEAFGIEGRTIEFFAGDRAVGTATTNADGVAVLDIPAREARGAKNFEAVFAGDDFFTASRGTSQT